MTDTPSIHALRARLAAIIAECAADMGDQFCAQCEEKRDTIRVLDAVEPLLRNGEPSEGLGPSLAREWIATQRALLAGEGGAT